MKRLASREDSSTGRRGSCRELDLSETHPWVSRFLGAGVTPAPSDKRKSQNRADALLLSGWDRNQVGFPLLPRPLFHGRGGLDASRPAVRVLLREQDLR